MEEIRKECDAIFFDNDVNIVRQT